MILQAPEGMLLRMGLKGMDAVPVFKDAEEESEIEAALSHRQMLVSRSIVIVQMKLDYVGVQGLHPVFKRRL